MLKQALVVATVGASFLLVSCQSVNTTNAGAVGVERKQYMFSMLSSQDVNQMYAQSYQSNISQAAAQGKLDRTSRNAQRLEVIGQRLIAQVPVFRADAVNWPWEVNLIKSPELNASCGPGGKIIFYSGIIEQLNLTDDEIAAIMGHEIAHALREHSREAMSRAYGMELTKQGAAALFGLDQNAIGLADAAVQYGMTLPNSRGNENEADLIGLELAARAGYDPNAAVSLWRKMQQAAGSAPPEFMSTHPSSESRISSLQAAIPKVMPLYQQARRR